MGYQVAFIKREFLQSARKTERGLIIIFAECVDKDTADYISAMFQEQGISTFVYSFDEGLRLQEKYKIMRGSVNSLSIYSEDDS